MSPNPLPPAAVDLLRRVNNGEVIEDCREKFWERIALCVESNMSESEAESVALSDLRAYVARLRPQGEFWGE